MTSMQHLSHNGLSPGNSLGISAIAVMIGHSSNYVNPAQVSQPIQAAPNGSQKKKSITNPKRRRTDTPDDPSAQRKNRDGPRKKKANRACFHCQKAHLTCDDCEPSFQSPFLSPQFIISPQPDPACGALSAVWPTTAPRATAKRLNTYLMRKSLVCVFVNTNEQK